MNTANNEVIEGEATPVPEQSKETRVVNYSVTMAEIAKLQEEYKEVPADLTVKANYEMVRKAAAHLRGLRGDVEKRRKELKADALAWGKLVDGTAKEITEKLLAIEEPFATAKKEFDTAAEIAKREAAIAEERRVDGIAERIANIRALVEKNISSPSASIKLDMEALEQGGMADEWAMEFAEKANTAISETLAKLGELLAMKLQQETFAVEQAKAEETRKIQEEEARKQREKEVEEERAKLAAERQAMEAERARMAAEQKARDDAAAAEKAEADRIQKEKDDAAEAERKKLADELAALKLQQEEKEKPADPVIEAKKEEPAPEPRTEQPTTAGDYAAEYRVTGNAMLKFIGNKTVTKNLLDAIISNTIPNVKFTGATK